MPRFKDKTASHYEEDHKAVCDGTLTLQEAQKIIASDWFRYYRDHVLK